MPSSSHRSGGSSRRTSTSTKSSVTTWQDQLSDACEEYGVEAPNFQIVSERRGGRTAWSSRVTVHGYSIEARYWYDGKNVNNMKEDAAERAVAWLQTMFASSSSSSSAY